LILMRQMTLPFVEADYFDTTDGTS